jgi:thioredoxin
MSIKLIVATYFSEPATPGERALRRSRKPQVIARSVSLFSVALFLALSSVSYGILLGDWEKNMDGWTNAGYGAVKTYSTTGATLNQYSLKIIAPSGLTDAIVFDVIAQNRVDDFRKNNKISVDVTRLASEWIGSGSYCELLLCVNAGGSGWSLRQDVEEHAPWNPSQGDQPITVIYDLSEAISHIQFDNLDYLEILFCTNYSAGYTGGIYYLDNLRMVSDLIAYNPHPADGDTDVQTEPTLSWSPGMYADTHNVYFGTDFNDVNNATADSHPNVTFTNVDVNNFKPGTLGSNKNYYWRIDEVNDAHPDRLWKGVVWSFVSSSCLVVDDFEAYNDTDNRIYQTWLDYSVNNSGMTVGHLEPPFAEQQIFHGGSQSMYMRYDNDGIVNEGTNREKILTSLYSEAERHWAEPQDWTKDGVAYLALWFRGFPESVGSFTGQSSNYTMTAAGADIGGTADQFHFAYKSLSGNGSISANVVSLKNTDSWAKAGVMIRQSLAADSKHATVVVTPGNGVSFLRRLTDGANSEETTQVGLNPPQCVRLSRSGNTLTAEYLANGATWVRLGSVDMPMLGNVYIGLCLTSHNVNATAEASFSNVANSGTGDWQSQDIGIPSNTAEPLYIELEDSEGRSFAIEHYNPAATTIGAWKQWSIYLKDFLWINIRAIEKMSIRVGDRLSAQHGGAGSLFIDDIRLYITAPTGVIDLTSVTFDQTISNSAEPVLVDLYTPWCPFCEQMAPIIQEIADEYANKAKICRLNANYASEIVRRYEVISVPTLFLFKNGQLIKKWKGVTSKQDLTAAIDALL